MLASQRNIVSTRLCGLAVVALCAGLLSGAALAAEPYEDAYQKVVEEYRKAAAGQKLKYEQALEKAEEVLAKGAEASAMIKLGVAKAEDLPKLKKQQEDADSEALKFYQVALTDAPANGDEKIAEKLNEIRYRLTITHYQRKEFDKAMAVGEYLARTAKDYEFAPQAARAAMYAYIQSFNLIPPADRGPFTDRMVNFVTYIGTTWRNAPEGQEAFGRLADIAFASGDRNRAEEIARQLPANSPARGDILLKAALSRYSELNKLKALPMGDKSRPSDAEMKERTSELKTALLEGTGAARKSVKNTVPYSLLAGELALVQMYADAGQFDQALKLLELPGTGLLDQAQAKSDSLKTPSGQSIASEVYKSALRCYVGMQNLTRAEQMLREMAGQSADQAALTKMYYALANQTFKEVERLREQGGDPVSLKASLDGLSKLLESAAARKEGQNFGTLSWAGQTLTEMAEKQDTGGAQVNPVASVYYAKAAAIYTDILKRATESKDFTDERNIAGIRVQLAKSQRRLGNYSVALEQITGVLKKFPQNLEAQQVAAATYQQWGQSTNDVKHLESAINGANPTRTLGLKDDEKLIWGWAKLMSTTRVLPKYVDTFRESRLQFVSCRFHIAVIKKNSDDLKKVAEMILSMHRVDPELGGYRTRYNDLLRVVQGTLNQEVVGLPAAPAPTPPTKQ